jgi:hypothetical protein
MKQPAHARLQIAIEKWMLEEMPECAPLFERHPEDGDYTGVAIGRTGVLEASLVSCAAADAAYTVVAMAARVVKTAQETDD